MDAFEQLLRHFKAEREHQERLFDLLTNERSAIVHLDRKLLPKLSEQKELLLKKARAIEAKRSQLIASIAKSAGKEGPLKLAEIITLCALSATRQALQREGSELKQKALQVQALFQENTNLIRQTQGIVATTLSILTSRPETDLPTYGQDGKLEGKANDATLMARFRGLKREA